MNENSGCPNCEAMHEKLVRSWEEREALVASVTAAAKREAALKGQLAKVRNADRANDPMAAHVNALGEHYRTVTGKTRAWTFDDDRFALAKRALKLKGYESDKQQALGVCMKACDGAAAFPFVSKGSKRGDLRARTGSSRDRQDHFELVFRNAAYIEKFVGLADAAGESDEAPRSSSSNGGEPALAEVCDCGHPRVDHREPALWGGRSPCAHSTCDCEDFDALQRRADEWIRAQSQRLRVES